MSIIVRSNIGRNSKASRVCQYLFQWARPSEESPDDSVSGVADRLLTGRLLVETLTMLIPNNTRRRLATTRCDAAPGPIIATTLLGMVLALWPASPLRGQLVAAPIEDDYPNAADVVQAYASLRSWTDAFALPALDEPAAQAPLGRAHGVCIIVRRSGRVLGTGVDGSGDALMLRRAAGRAFGEVLGNPVVSQLPPTLRATMGTKLTVELEVAGRPVPLLGQSFGWLARQVEPGLDGLAIRRGNDWALSFPAIALAHNNAGNIQRQLLPLAVELGLPAAKLGDLLTRPDVSIYRFRTTHLAQSAANKRPFRTVRGDVVVARSEVTPSRVAALADSIAQHLLRSFSSPKIARGLLGTYQPSTDQYKPIIAAPREQALAAFALAQYAEAPSVDPLTARRAGQASRQILLQLQVGPGAEDNPLADIEACAAIVYGGFQHVRTMQDPAIRPLLIPAAQRAIDAFSLEAGFVQRDPTTNEARPISPNGQALLAAALSRLLSRGYQHDRLTPQLVRSAMDKAWQSVPDYQHVMLLPWLGWAELEYSSTVGEPLANVTRLLEIRSMLDSSRIGSQFLPGAADLAGGFVLIPMQGVVANAQTLRPAAFLATMLRQSDLTRAQDAEAALDRHLDTVRFLMQLTVRETSSWSLQNPSQALGGVRTATWDNDQPVPAQALGLLTAVQTLWSLEALAQGQGNQ